MILVEILLSIIMAATTICLIIIPEWKKWTNKLIKLKFAIICTVIILLSQMGIFAIRLLNEDNYWIQLSLIVVLTGTAVFGLVYYYLWQRHDNKKESNEKGNS